MFKSLKKAIQNAKTRLKHPSGKTAVVQNDNGELDVLDDPDEIEECIEQVVGTYEYDGLNKEWTNNPDFDRDRLHPDAE